ncbi:hypothetical protein FS837_000683 [Tulasnella sp. UAMH 9824]|nr:hypothetical protein FS837_000683 [Tulasnella sp. UAMH 9824]
MDAARQLRHDRHGTQDKYEQLVKGWEDGLKSLMDRRLIEAAIGLEKSGRQLDRHARLFLAVELAKYRQKFRGPEALDSKESKAAKDRVLAALFDTFPDLAPDNRIFKSQGAEAAYEKQLDIYFRGRLQLCDKKEKEFQGSGIISRQCKILDEVLLASSKRRKTALNAWLSTLESDANEWELFEQREAEFTELWLEANPNGNLADNRLQLERAAKRAVFNDECRKDPKLYDRAKKLAHEKKVASQTFSGGSKTENALDGAAVMSYIAARVSDLTELSITIIMAGELEVEGKATVYVQQYGFPRGQALVDKSPNSTWSKTVDPMIADFVSRISPESTGVHFAEVVPNLDTSALDSPLEDEVSQDQSQIQLTPFDWEAESSKKRAKAYFETNICNLRSISNVMWKTITGKPERYLLGLPDVVFYATGHYDVDPATGKIKPHPIKFTNPDDWTENDVMIWEDHIAKSEDGLLPADQTLAFVDRSGRVHYACSATDKTPLDDEFPVALTNSAPIHEAQDDAEDFTDQIAGVQAMDEDDHSNDDIGDRHQPPITDEEARDLVIKVKTERMAHSSANTSPVQSMPAAFAPPASPIAHRADYPQLNATTELPALEQDRYSRRSMEVVPWKGLPPPVHRGPQLSSSIEAIILDEHLSFNDILMEELNLSGPFERVHLALADHDPLVQLLWKEHGSRLLNVEEAPPQIHLSQDLYRAAFDPLLSEVLSAIEAGLRQLFCSKAFLEHRLGGSRGILLLFRALSMLYPLYTRSSIKNRFVWSAVRLHYFTTLILSVRRSFLAAKTFINGLVTDSSTSYDPRNPFATALLAWDQALTIRLQAWANLILLEDLQPLSEISSPNVRPESDEGALYHSVVALRWYDVPAPGSPWQISLPISSSSISSTVTWIQTIIPSDLSICSLCHFATCIFAMMVAERPRSDWEADPAWSILIKALQKSSLWTFEPPTSSSRSDVTSDLNDQHSPASRHGDYPRSGTPISPPSSPIPDAISLGHPAAMRNPAQAQTSSLATPHAEVLKGPAAPEGATSEDDLHMGGAESRPDDSLSGAEDGVAGETLAADAPLKELGKETELQEPPARALRSRKGPSDNTGAAKPKRKGANSDDPDHQDEPGPSSPKRPRTRAASAKELIEDEAAPPPKKPATANRQSKAKATPKPKVTPKPKPAKARR